MIYPTHTAADNHVNNTVYFSFYEEVRVRAWRKSTGSDSFAASGIAPVLQDTWTHFRLPLSLFDIVHIGMRAEHIEPETASFQHRYCVWSERFGAVAAEGGAGLVLCDFANGGKRARNLSVDDIAKWT